MLFRQLFDRVSCTYTYLLADGESREAVLIDSVIEHNKRDLQLIEELSLSLKYILETHVHADHMTGARKLKEVTGAQVALGKASQHLQADLLLDDGDVLTFGSREIVTLATPGHTQTCVTYACDNLLFTGDTLFIRGCGRTDFQGGSAEELYHSVHQKIYSYPDETLIYPGHDYNGRTVSSVGEEKRYNPRLKTQPLQPGLYRHLWTTSTCPIPNSWIKLSPAISTTSPREIEMQGPLFDYSRLNRLNSKLQQVSQNIIRQHRDISFKQCLALALRDIPELDSIDREPPLVQEARISLQQMLNEVIEKQKDDSTRSRWQAIQQLFTAGKVQFPGLLGRIPPYKFGGRAPVG